MRRPRSVAVPNPLRCGLLLGLLVVLLTGCKTRASLDLALREDGGGTLTITTEFDEQARRLSGAPPSNMSKSFRDLAELEAWFETPGEPDLIRWDQTNERTNLWIDVPSLMRRIAGDRGSQALDGALSALTANGEGAEIIETSADVRLRIRSAGTVVDHNADHAEDGGTDHDWLEWRLWPSPTRPARVTIVSHRARVAGRSAWPHGGVMGAATAVVMGALARTVHTRRRRRQRRRASPSFRGGIAPSRSCRARRRLE